jgi:hypothetical protein
MEGSQIILEETIRIIDSVSVLANDPDNCCLCLRFIKFINILNDSPDNAFISIRVFAENIANNNRGLLNDIWNFRINQVKKSVNAFLRSRLNFDS